MLDAWLDAVVLLQVGPGLCAGVVLAEPAVPAIEGIVVTTASPPDTGEVLIATAYHCVASGVRPYVRFRDGEAAPGRVIARDPAHDLALVRAPGDGTGLPLRDGDPAVGETVYALGHPFGQATGGKLDHLLVWSVSKGIVGGVGPWLVQTDTALNPGNSGGPLVDEQGRVVGIVSRKIKAEGLGFAAKSDRVAELVKTPDRGPLLGGAWGAGVGFFQGERAEIGAHAFVAVRERVVTRAWLGVGLGDLQPFGLLTVEARQRVGRGPLSTTFDLGGGGRWSDAQLHPVLSARVGIASIGFGAHVEPGPWTWTATLDLEIPGRLGVF
jgi:S1-C subfamily serine protease